MARHAKRDKPSPEDPWKNPQFLTSLVRLVLEVFWWYHGGGPGSLTP